MLLVGLGVACGRYAVCDDVNAMCDDDICQCVPGFTRSTSGNTCGTYHFTVHLYFIHN